MPGMEYWVAEQDAMKFAESLALLGFRGLQVPILRPGTETAPASLHSFLDDGGWRTTGRISPHTPRGRWVLWAV